MKNKKRRNWIIAGVALLLIILVGVFNRGDESKKVQVEQLAMRDITEQVSASGKLEPVDEVKVQSDVSGQIVELPVKEGDKVKKGQLLVKINPQLYTAALQRAEATLNSSKSNLSSARARLLQAQAQSKAQELSFKRMEKLYADKAISASEMDNARSTYETAVAEVSAAGESIKSAEFAIESARAGRDEASENLRRTTILAPIDGTVTALTKEVGEAVLGNNMTSGEVIMKISGLNTMEVNVEVNETDIVRVNLGDTAEIKVDAFRDKVFKGIVTEIGNTALNMMNSGVGASTEQVTNFSVKVMVLADSYQAMLTLQGDSPFRPGMSATVDILTQRVKGVSSIPIKAVTQREDSITHTAKVCVFVMDEQMHQAKLKFIEIGIQDDQYIEVIKGLEKTDKVITGPYDEISKGLNAGDAVMEGEPEMSKAES